MNEANEIKVTNENSLIIDWIANNSKILDLGCGDGALLSHLIKHKGATGYGLELDENNILKSIDANINLLQLNLDKENLSDYFGKNSVDYIIMTQTLQVIKRPDLLLKQMVEIGKYGIVTFPNFAHWRLRLQLLLTGRTPASRSLPYHWYNTPNIRILTFKDFEKLCEQCKITIVKKTVYDYSLQGSKLLSLFPNTLGAIGIFKITK